MRKIPEEKLESLRQYPISMRLQQLRYYCDISQRELAEAINCTQMSIVDWESGKILPSWRSLKKIIAFYDLPDTVFIDWTVERTKMRKNRLNLNKTINKEDESLIHFGSIDDE